MVAIIAINKIKRGKVGGDRILNCGQMEPTEAFVDSADGMEVFFLNPNFHTGIAIVLTRKFALCYLLL